MEWEAVKAGSQQADHGQARPYAGRKHGERSVTLLCTSCQADREPSSQHGCPVCEEQDSQSSLEALRARQRGGQLHPLQLELQTFSLAPCSTQSAVCQFDQAAITNTTNGMVQATEMYASQFERLEVRNQWAGRVASSEASLLGLQMAAFSLSSHGHFSV